MSNSVRQASVLVAVVGLTAGCAAQAVPPSPTSQPYVPPTTVPSPFPTPFPVNTPVSTPTPEPTTRPLIELPQVQIVDPQLFAITERSPLTREEDTGAVVVEVTPIGWPLQPGGDLSFQVALNTHSVDINYDLSQISFLRSSDGVEISALSWENPAMGGHHVMGTLNFPPLELDGSSWIELDMYDIADVPVRTFRWEATDYRW